MKTVNVLCENVADRNGLNQATGQKIDSYLQCMPERALSAEAPVIDMSLARINLSVCQN